MKSGVFTFNCEDINLLTYLADLSTVFTVAFEHMIAALPEHFELTESQFQLVNFTRMTSKILDVFWETAF